jgi:hypothetical protein
MANLYADALGKPVREGKVRKARPSPSHLRAVKQEKETAKRLRGMLTPASGAKDMKGDVRVPRVARIECKTTKNKSFSVTLDLVRKIEDAGAEGEATVLLIEFNDGAGKKLGELAVIPAYLLDEFCERMK